MESTSQEWKRHASWCDICANRGPCHWCGRPDLMAQIKQTAAITSEAQQDKTQNPEQSLSEEALLYLY
jgi:hypothetical protein